MFPAHFTLQSPLWLLALAAPAFALWLRTRRRASAWVVPFCAAWGGRAPAISRLPLVLGTAGAVLLILALARPQWLDEQKRVTGEGYDLMLAIDLSGSMLAEDYERNGEPLNRLDVIKPVIAAFIGQRPSDRIGVAVFAGRAYTLSPLTFDHAWLARQIGRMTTDIVEGGTAIGDGLGVALARLEQRDRTTGGATGGVAGDVAGGADGTGGDAKVGKRLGAFVILLTDGANNAGALSPEQATALAKTRGIPVYAIGVGKTGVSRVPVFDEDGRRRGTRRMRSDLDEGALRRIAAETGGRYFRADEPDAARRAFEAIDAARKITFQTSTRVSATELFPYPAGTGLALVLLAALLSRRRR
jgi:Ca-activated chloride channel family protein